MVNGRLASRVRRIETRKGAQQCCDNGHNLASFADVLGSLLEQEECCLGIDTADTSVGVFRSDWYKKLLRKHLVVFSLADFDNRLLQHHSYGIDEDVDFAVLLDDVGEELLTCRSSRQIANVD